MPASRSNNTRVLVDQLIKDQWDQEPDQPFHRQFEFFACDQVLKGLDLSPDEISAGIIGGGDDGGIDGVYTFVNGELIAEDSEIFQEDFSVSDFSRDVLLTLHLVQAKTRASFTETAIDLASSSTKRLLDLTKNEGKLQKLYSAELVDRFVLFRNALHRLALRHPRVAIEFTYVTRGDTSSINRKVKAKASDLQDQWKAEHANAEGIVRFMGSHELWLSATKTPSYTLQLTYRENATSGTRNATSGTSHVALVSLRDYLKFISNEEGELHRHIFDWNVRDYQGGVEVNREIRNSLTDAQSPDFWWLNNGVTVICTRASIQGKTYTLDDVQIVNGLQTSYAMHETLSAMDENDPAFERSVLVRILETEDQGTRDRVIRATNRQTSIPQASLRATDGIQRQIEAHFAHADLYDDRRKNYYRNIGKPSSRIVGIPFLAQAVMAIGLSRPDDARARPSSLLKSDSEYEAIFSQTIDLDVYLWAARAQREVDAFLQSSEARTTPLERTNLRYHLAMLAAAKLTGARVHHPSQLGPLARNGSRLADADLAACLTTLREILKEFMDLSGESMDKVAKGRQFVESILMTVPEPPQDGSADQP